MPLASDRRSRSALSRLSWMVPLGAAVLAALSGCLGSDVPGPVTQQSIKHVFVITMENKDFADSFGTSKQDPYLQGLTKQGALLSNYC